MLDLPIVWSGRYTRIDENGEEEGEGRSIEEEHRQALDCFCRSLGPKGRSGWLAIGTGSLDRNRVVGREG